MLPSKVSMVMPCYNKEKYIGNMFDSILAQEWDNIELILVNDGSTDGTREVIEQYETKFIAHGFEVVIINQENRGVCAAAKTGLERITGDFVCCVDADDELDPRYCSTMAGYLAEHPDYDFCICEDRHYLNTDYGKVFLPIHIPNPPEDLNNLALWWIFGEYQCSIWRYIVRRSYFDKCNIVQNYYIETKWSHEPSFAVPLLLNKGKYKCFNLPLYLFQDAPVSHSKGGAEHMKMYRENYTRLILFSLERIDSNIVGDEEREEFLLFTEFERRVQELYIGGTSWNNADFIKTFDMLESSELLSKLIKRALLKNKEDCLIPALKDYLLGQRSYNRIIFYGAMGKTSAPFVQWVEEGREVELWDERGDGGKVKRPDFDNLLVDDLLCVLPANEKVYYEVLAQAGKEKTIIYRKTLEESYNLIVMFPELYLKKYRGAIRWKSKLRSH